MKFRAAAIAIVLLLAGTLVLGCASTEDKFADKYGTLSNHELLQAILAAHGKTRVSIRARFDRLFSQFSTLLAEGKFGAKLSLDAGNHTTIPGMASSFRFVTDADGFVEGHYLEFAPREDPALADLFAEEDWLMTQLRSR